MQKNRTIIIFLIKFFATYFILFGAYSLYLNKTQQKGEVFACAPITATVANHVNKVSRMLGYQTRIEQHQKELSIKLFINEKYVSRIIEGCNAISIIILFLAFIIAFSGRLKATVLFGLFGVTLIYVVNILRIVAFAKLYDQFPEYQSILHDLIFPSIIYGLVFVLWVTWVKNFSNISKNASK